MWGLHAVLKVIITDPCGARASGFDVRWGWCEKRPSYLVAGWRETEGQTGKPGAIYLPVSTQFPPWTSHVPAVGRQGREARRYVWTFVSWCRRRWARPGPRFPLSFSSSGHRAVRRGAGPRTLPPARCLVSDGVRVQHRPVAAAEASCHQHSASL